MQRFIQFSLQSSAIGVGETKWVRNGFGRPEGTGTELGWDQICSSRKKEKEIPSGCSQQGKAGKCWCCLAGEIICMERTQLKQIS